MNMSWPIGASSILVRKIQPEFLASRWGNDADVLATPILLWLSELACMKVVEGHLPQGTMTVGHGHNSKHLAPTPSNFTIEIMATLLKVDGRILLFRVQGTDGRDEIIVGEHTRALIDTALFYERVRKKEQSAAGDPQLRAQKLA